MKKFLFLIGLVALFACSKSEQAPQQSILANTFGVTVKSFDADNATKVTTTTNESYKFNWSASDVIGVFPLTVDDRQVGTQLGCALESSSAESAVFRGTGWGLICNGNYEYASYYPYSADNSVNAIKVSFPANLNISYNKWVSQISPYVHLYAPAIKPSDVEAATFNFQQVGALAHFVISAPSNVEYTKLVISTNENVFTTEGSYDLRTVTSVQKPVIVPTVQVNAIGMSLGTTTSAIKLTDGQNLELYFIMCPAKLKDKTLNFKLFDGNNNKYTGSYNCGKDQESGKIYKYSVSLTKETTILDPSTIEGVDLGHPIYLFAPFNLGATSIEETGDFFAWGDIATKKTFTPDNTKLAQEGHLDYDYILNNVLQDNPKSAYKIFKPEYDAAAQIWGNGWMIPNYIEINGFLQDQCDKEWVTINGTQGWKCYNKKDHSKWIFLPATGRKEGSTVSNTYIGYYRTSYISGSGSSVTTFIEVCEKKQPSSMGGTTSMHNGLAIRPVKFKE